MATPVLICDDSSLARKQMARALPADWDIELSFAANGEEAVTAIKAGKADVLFLDLNMPVMNGYEVLDAIRAQDLPTMVLVVSGDIQADAYRRVISKGALDFVQKPVSTERIRDILARFGIVSASAPSEKTREAADTAPVTQRELTDTDCNFVETLQEVVNVAMGQAGSKLADLLGTFIQLPVPQVHLCEYSELKHRLGCRHSQTLTAVSHGFNGSGISGEAVLVLGADSFPPLISLMHEESGNYRQQELGVLVDLSGLLIGACLQGVSEQLDLDINHSFPVVLGREKSVADLLGHRQDSSQVAAVEINYQFLEGRIQCHLLLLIGHDSIARLTERMELLQ
ncbi:MAG: response regulator [Pseudomonadota bacterium]